jgi:hypothetical protein
MVMKDPDNSDNCFFLNTKMNVAQKAEGYSYNIINSGNGIGVPAWGKERVNKNPDDILNTLPVPKPSPAQDEVLALIKERHPAAVKSKEIQDKLNISAPQASNIFKEMKSKGLIKDATGLYGYYQLSLSHTNPIGNRSESESSQVLSHL